MRGTDRVPANWLRTPDPRPGAGVQLVCFPHAGGNAGAFRQLAGRLPRWLELVAVQYPGRQDRFLEPPRTDLGTLADEVTAAVAGTLTRPTAFLGHSMGATVAFEVARRLRPRFPSPLRWLFVSARKAPAECRPLALDFQQDEQVRAFVRGLGGAGAAALSDEDVWQLTLPALRTDLLLTAAYRYAPGSPLTCPVTAITGRDDASLRMDDAMRWADYTVAGFDAQSLPGGHFYLEESPAELAALLADKLGRFAAAAADADAAASAAPPAAVPVGRPVGPPAAGPLAPPVGPPAGLPAATGGAR